MELKTAKGRLFLFLLLIIFLPLLENTFGFIRSAKLEGYVVLQPDARFSPATWWNGSYQFKKTLHINDSVGFRPDMARMTNQIDFWLFKKMPPVAVVGKNGYLFDKGYVDEYEGRSYIGDDAIRATLIKLKFIQDTFEHMGKTLVFAYAPSKPYFMPENIPPSLRRSGGKVPTNYEAFKRLGDSLKIKALDYNALFIAMKDTSKNPLFTRQGIHWSIYGSLLASDTLIKLIERERNISMPHPVITKLCYPDTVIYPDDDLAICSNLVFPLAKEKLCYPEYHYTADSTKAKPKIVFIGDSFGEQWKTNELFQNISKDWEYWYYFYTVRNQQSSLIPTAFINNYNWQQSILNTDCIVLIYNPTNLQLQTNQTNFIEKMYAYFYTNKK